MYKKKNDQNPCMINKNQRCKIVTLLKSLKLVQLVQLVQLVYWYFLMILLKWTFYIFGFGLTCMALVIFIFIQIVFP